LEGKQVVSPAGFGVDHPKVYRHEVTTEWRAGMIHHGLAALKQWNKEEYAARSKQVERMSIVAPSEGSRMILLA
jgi:hypothetical protein